MKVFWKILPVVIGIARELPGIVADGKVTVRELLDLAVRVANQLGFNVDDEGLTLQ